MAELMQFSFFRCLIFVAFISSNGLGFAASDVKKTVSSSVNTDPRILSVNAALPAAISRMIQTGNGVRLIDRFDAGSGMTGYVMAAKTGERRIYYVTPDGVRAFYGLMFDERLENLTAQHQSSFMDASEFLRNKIRNSNLLDSPSSASSLLDPLVSLKTGRGANASGDEGAVAYVIADPTSPLSAAFFRASLKARFGSSVHWIFHENNHREAPADAGALSHNFLILYGQDQAARRAHFDFSMVSSKTALRPKILPQNSESLQKLASEIAHVRSMFGNIPLPIMIYHDIEGQLQISSGLPAEVHWRELSYKSSQIQMHRRMSRHKK